MRNNKSKKEKDAAFASAHLKIVKRNWRMVMEKETKKKIQRVAFIGIAVVLLVIAYGILLHVQGNTKEQEKIPEKIKEELSFLDNNVVAMLNYMNNIVYEPYTVQTEKASGSKTSSSSQNEQGGDSTGGQEQNGNSDGNSTSKENTTGQSSSGSQNGSQNGNQTSEPQISKMQDTGILNLDTNTIKWTTIKQQIEVVYASWNTIAIDLHSVPVNQDSILQFNTNIQQAIQAIKAEDKVQSLVALANLYALLPEYTEGALQDKKETEIYQTKAGIINAYALLEQDKWDEMKTHITKAQEIFANRMNQVNESPTTQATIHKIYMGLKEMENICTLQDKEMFLMNYKEIMQLLDSLR